MRASRIAPLAFVLSSVANAQQPCALLSQSSRADRSLPAGLALQCLRSIPVQTGSVRNQLAGLELLTSFQSDLAYLNNSEPARLYPNVDLLGGLSTLQQRIQDNYYSNEYDLQLDVYRLYASAYDGHLVYIPDIVAAFAFVRLGPSGDRYPLVSVSSDGVQLPEIHPYQDLPLLATSNARAAYVPSPIQQIDGRDVQDFLNEQAALSGAGHDPDANYNLLFPIDLAPNMGTIFEEFSIVDESNQTVLTFANGTETNLEIRAVSTLDLSGVTDGQSFFELCCTGAITGSLSDDAGTGSPAEAALTALKSLGSGHDQLLADVVRARPPLRQPELDKRQSAPEGPVVSLGGNNLAGYFPEAASDLAVLTLPTFNLALDENAISNFQTAVADFLAAASDAGKSRLIVDLRGNGGGLGFLAHDTFRQIFPTAFPYDASNYRAIPLFDFTGQFFSDYFAGVSAADFSSPQDAPPFFSGGLPFNYRQSLDESNSTFDSWSDLFGPAETPDLDNFTNLIRPNLTDILQTYFPVYPVGRTASERSRPQVFRPENIVLLQDGGCASACALFTEFMKSSGPTDGDQQVRQVVVGGRPQTGPQQGVGLVKGGQLGVLVSLGSAVATAIDSASADLLRTFQSDLDITGLNDAVTALDRAAVNPGDSSSALGSLPAATVNFRNTIREGDDTVTPLQYVYDAADCRIFYTASMYLSREELWRKVYEVSWQDGECVEGSTGHPSAQFGTNYEDIEIPDSARSEYSVSISGMEGSNGPSESDGGGQPDGPGNGSGDGDGDGDEDGQDNAAVRSMIPLQAVMLLFASIVLFGMI